MNEDMFVMIVWGITIVGLVWLVLKLFIDEIKERKEKNKDIGNKLRRCESGIFETLANYFDNDTEGSKMDYELIFDFLQKFIEEIKTMNREVSRRKRISKQEIASYEKMAKQYKKFCVDTEKRMKNVLIDSRNYGAVQKATLNHIKSMQKADVDSKIQHIQEVLEQKSYKNLWKVDVLEIKQYLWFYALHKPYSAMDFDRTQSIFNRVYKNANIEVLLAEIYAIKQVGGTDILKNKIKEVLKDEQWLKYIPKKEIILQNRKINNISGAEELLTTIASGLMWMKAYSEESMVLQYMLENRIQMSSKLQDRLHALSNGGGKAPSGFDVTSSSNEIYFDVSSLAWKEEEYVGLFENLAFQDKTLNYSLAIRDDDKDLFIAQGINVPEIKVVLGKFKDVFTEEYGSCVVSQQVSCTTLSGSGQEKMEGILVSSTECKQMSIFIHIARIGKKLIIKFYTLFMPTDADLATQKQQALSMYKKLSPSVTMWESSLKDTMLMAVEQLLNASVSPEDSGSENVPADGELVF